MRSKLPTATRVGYTPSSTKWKIEFPSTPRKAGKAYFATTYTDSQLIYVTTGANQRPIAKGVGRKLHPKIRAAIDAVLASELALTVAGAFDEKVEIAVEATPEMIRDGRITVHFSAPAGSVLAEMFKAVPPVGSIDEEG